MPVDPNVVGTGLSVSSGVRGQPGRHGSAPVQIYRADTVVGGLWILELVDRGFRRLAGGQIYLRPTLAASRRRVTDNERPASPNPRSIRVNPAVNLLQCRDFSSSVG